MTEFLVQEKGFSEQRVANAIKKLKNLDTKGMQSRLDSFFGVSKKKSSTPAKDDTTAKKDTKKTKVTKPK